MKNNILIFCALLFTSTSSINAQDKIQNLKTFAKAYGYAKYFNPSDEAASIDWNNFSAHGAEKIINCKSQIEVIHTLNELFQPIGPGIRFSDTKKDYDFSDLTPKTMEGYLSTYWQHLGVSSIDMVYHNHPQLPYESVRVNHFTKINESESFGNLKNSIDAEKYKGKEIKFTGWVKLKSSSEGTGHLWLKVEKSDNTIGFFNNMSDEPIRNTKWEQYEIIGIVDDLATSIVFGSYLNGKGTLYLDETKLFYKENNEWIEIPIKNNGFETDQVGIINDQTKWSGQSKGYSYNVSNNENKEGNNCAVITYKGKFRKIINDTIFSSYPKFGELIEKEIGPGIFCQIPLTLYNDKEITYPKSNNLSDLQNHLSTINKSPRLLPVRLGNIINIYNVMQHFYPYFNEINVDWDKEFEKTLERSFRDQSPKDHLTIIYLNLDVIDMDGINKLLPRLTQAKGIICDFRGYSYSVYEFISHLTSEHIITESTSRISKIIYPDQKNSIGYQEIGGRTIEAKDPYLGDKKVVFITDGRAISAAEGTMIDVKEYNLATIIGQPTAGTNGMINPFTILGNYVVYYTGYKIVNTDGSQFHGVGILPDIYVEKTIEGVKAGKDEFLEKAIEIINN